MLSWCWMLMKIALWEYYLWHLSCVLKFFALFAVYCTTYLFLEDILIFFYCAGLLYDGSAWAWLGEFLRCCYFSKKLVFTNLLIVMAPQTNIIVRPSKHSLPLQKLTNLSSEWKVGRFWRFKKCFAVNRLFFVFSF